MRWSETNETGRVAVHGGLYRIYGTKLSSECKGFRPNTRNILPELRWYNTTPYKHPEKLQVDNATFNYWVSRVRVRSEHCISFLKGWFNLLRGLQIQINSQRNLA